MPRVKTAAPSDGGKGPATVKVRATRLGYFDHARRRVGDVFTLPILPADPASGKPTGPYGRLFSARWMEVVDPSTPEQLTTGKQELQRQHDEILGARAGARANDTSVE